MSTALKILAHAAEKFDSAGSLTDQHTKEKIQELLTVASVWVVQWRNIKQSMKI